ALEPWTHDHGSPERAQRGGHHGDPGDAQRRVREVREPDRGAQRRVDRGRIVTSSPRILVADDQQDVLEALRMLLKAVGFEMGSASSPAGVVKAVQREDFDLVLIDLNYTRDTTSGREGLDL